MIMCVQCTMRALLDDKPPPSFGGTVEEHMAKYHPDPVATKIERLEMEEKLKEQVRGQLDVKST